MCLNPDPSNGGSKLFRDYWSKYKFLNTIIRDVLQLSSQNPSISIFSIDDLPLANMVQWHASLLTPHTANECLSVAQRWKIGMWDQDMGYLAISSMQYNPQVSCLESTISKCRIQ